MTMGEEISQITATKPPKRYDVLDITGGDGPWQRQIFFVLFFLSVPSAAFTMAITFMAPDMDYWCARPSMNFSLTEWKKHGLPSTDKHCSKYKYANTTTISTLNDTSILPCEFWEYDKSFYKSTIMSQWDLVCERKWLVSTSESVYMLGYFVGGITSGYSSDRIGRRPTTVAFCYLMIISASICAFSSFYAMFLTTRFFTAVGVGGIYNNLFILMMEVLEPSKRCVYGSLVLLGWSFGVILLPFVAWLSRDWFWIQIVLALLALAFLGIWWMIPESPRWLLTKGKMEEAKCMLRNAAMKNGKNLSEIEIPLTKVICEANEKSESGETKGKFLDMILTPGLRQITFTLFYSWLVTSFIYFGLSFNTNQIAGDPFVNFTLLAVVESPGYVFSIFSIKYLGRNSAYTVTLIVAGLVFLVSYFVQSISWLSFGLLMVGKFCITSCHGINFLFSSEMLPTVVRSTAMGWCGCFKELGSITAPFVQLLVIYIGAFAPFAVYGSMSLSCGVLFFFLPQAADRSVPDTMRDAIEIAKKNDKSISFKAQNGSCEMGHMVNGTNFQEIHI